MAMQELTIKRRTETGKEVAKRLRRAGAVPAVLYDGQKAETVTVDPKAVLRMIHGREGTTQLLTLKFDGENGNGFIKRNRETEFFFFKTTKPTPFLCFSL